MADPSDCPDAHDIGCRRHAENQQNLYQQHNRSPFHINHGFVVRQWSGTVAATSVVFSKFEAHVAKSICEIQIADLKNGYASSN
jgi:hypothetical protein